MANLCGGETPDYVLQECGTESAGIIAVAYLDNSLDPTKTNLEDASWWTTNQATSPNVVWVVKKTRGSFDGASAVTQTGFGRENVRTTGAEATLTFEHEGLEENRDFVQSINERSDLNFVFITSGLKGFFVDGIDNYGTPIVDQDTKQIAFWRHTVQWQDFDQPIIFDAPSSVFDV
jgi:hypothetical protein